MTNAEVIVADKILTGGSGHFGTGTMPPDRNVKLTPDEAMSLSIWVLNTK